MVEELKQVLERIDSRLGDLEGSLIKNTKRIKYIESYTASKIVEARKMLPFVSGSDWETKLLTTIDVLGEIEGLITKLDEISIDSELTDQCNICPI